MSGPVVITFAESSIKDLEEVISYYEGQGVPHVGRKLVAEVIEDVQLLASNPEMGRMVPEFEMEYLRELVRPPFRIVYRCESKRVRIVRVWRSERLLKLP